jgi:hypothetical protein
MEGPMKNPIPFTANKLAFIVLLFVILAVQNGSNPPVGGLAKLNG